MALFDMARMFVAAAPGTGSILLGSAVSGYQTFAAAGITDSEQSSYNLSDFDANGNLIAWEVGSGTYESIGPMLARSPTYSSNGNSLINASARAQVWLTALAVDFYPAEQNVSVTGNGSVSVFQNGSVFDNDGAPSSVMLTLPPWQSGLIYSFIVVAGHAFGVQSFGSDQIAINGDFLDSLTSTLLYSYLTLGTSNVSGLWVVRSLVGGWGG